MHILITGASKGIGFAIARTFVQRLQTDELKLTICSRVASEIASAARELEAVALKRGLTLWVEAAVCDVSKEEEVDEFVLKAESRFGPVDLLVNNAGFGKFQPVEEMSFETFDSVIATNLRGVFLITQRVLPKMRAQRSGSVLTIGSLASKNGFSGGAAYCAAKFAVRGLMQSLFLEVREDNVRVTTIFPGSVDTDFFSTARAGEIRSNKALQAQDVADSVYMAATLPEQADISELDIRPTNPKG